MEKNLKKPSLLSRKKAALKKVYSGVAILSSCNKTNEFTELILVAKEIFRKYGIDELYKNDSGKVVSLADYKKRKEKV